MIKIKPDKPVTRNVTKKPDVTKKMTIKPRGRPKIGKTKSGSERQRAYLARKRDIIDIWADFHETVAADG